MKPWWVCEAGHVFRRPRPHTWTWFYMTGHPLRCPHGIGPQVNGKIEGACGQPVRQMLDRAERLAYVQAGAPGVRALWAARRLGG